MRFFNLYIYILLLLSSCRFFSGKSSQIAHPADYEFALKADRPFTNLIDIETELKFWEERLAKDTSNFIAMEKLAGLKTKRFRMTGIMEDLKESDAYLQRAAKQLGGKEADFYHHLCLNAITRHKFKLARDYNNQARKLTGDTYTSSLLAFDVAMELGSISLAKAKLRQLRNFESFDVLVRRSKLADNQGDLKKAIGLMEKAFDKIKDRSGAALYCWALANLGDMYGHAGEIEKSYKAYVEVLQKNPDYDYALKGIAWIAYAHDANSKEAKRILHYLIKRSQFPDYNLLLAEIAEFEGNQTKKEMYLTTFKLEAEKPQYEEMCNKYLALLYAGELKDSRKAIQIAREEIRNRPTVQSYDLLAWSLFQNGQIKNAARIVREFIEGASSEPEILYHAGVILKSAGERQKARQYLLEAKEANFELGPVTARQIEKALSEL